METKTYLIEFASGKKQKVTVPEDWKVTFGPAAVGISKEARMTNKIPLAIRFYEGNEKQRAIFTDVVNFRDMSIQIEEERIDVQQKEGYMECEGTRKGVTFQATSRQWVNPDVPQKNFPQLPADKNIFDLNEEM